MQLNRVLDVQIRIKGTGIGYKFGPTNDVNWFNPEFNWTQTNKTKHNSEDLESHVINAEMVPINRTDLFYGTSHPKKCLDTEYFIAVLWQCVYFINVLICFFYRFSCAPNSQIETVQ